MKLVIFDVDGTLVDSQADILASMAAAFDSVGQPSPSRAEVLGIVGLSLPQAMAALAPDQSDTALAAMVETYKTSYAHLRQTTAPAPLYPGIRGLLDRLQAQDDLLLGVATGKSRRGLEALIDSHGLGRVFVTTQCADDHPSKPHPSMLLTALAETGAEARDTVMIGDTSYDMQMAQAAGIAGIGVTWGYHPPDRLGAARQIAADVPALDSALTTILRGQS